MLLPRVRTRIAIPHRTPISEHRQALHFRSPLRRARGDENTHESWWNELRTLRFVRLMARCAPALDQDSLSRSGLRPGRGGSPVCSCCPLGFSIHLVRSIL